MSTKMLQGASLRLKNSHALVASLILGVAGSTMIVNPAMAQHRGGDRQQDAGSGMSRMGNMGRGGSSVPSPSPAPAPRVSSPAPAPRVSSPAPAPRMSAPAPAPRMSSPAPSISSPAPAPRVMAEPSSRSGSGGSPIMRMRPPEPSRTVDAPAPRQSAPAPRQVAPAPRVADAPRQPTSPAPSSNPRSRADVGGAPINRMRPADAVSSPANRTPRVADAPGSPSRAVEVPRAGTRSNEQGSSDLRSNLRTTPTPGSPIMQVRGNREPDSRPSTPPNRDNRGPRDGRDGRDGRGNDGRDGRGGDGRGDWNGRDNRDGRNGDWRGGDGRNRWNDRDGRNWNGRDGRDWNGNNWNGGHNDNWHGSRGNWNNNWHGNNWNNWHGSNWNRWNNWDHHHHHNHSNFSFLVAPSLFYSTWPYYYPYGYGSGVNWGLGFSWGSSSLYYNSYCAPRYYTYSDPLCIYPSYYRSRYYSYPLSYSLYYPPSYIDTYSSYYPSTTTYTYYDEPAYTDTYYYGSTLGSANNGLIDYSSKAPASMGGYTSDVYVNNGYAPAPSSVAQGTPAESAEPIMVYRASKDQGQLVWSDTPTNIVNNLLNATGDRAQVAQRYLGKTLAGGWEVTLDEVRKTADGGTVLTTRGTASSGTGSRPTIVVQVPRALTGLEVGQRLSVTGRLTELSVNDPDSAGGLLVLEEGDASW